MSHPRSRSSVPTGLVAEVETAPGSGEFVVDGRLDVEIVELHSGAEESFARLALRLGADLGPQTARETLIGGCRVRVRTDRADPAAKRVLFLGVPERLSWAWGRGAERRLIVRATAAPVAVVVPQAELLAVALHAVLPSRAIWDAQAALDRAVPGESFDHWLERNPSCAGCVEWESGAAAERVTAVLPWLAEEIAIGDRLLDLCAAEAGGGSPLVVTALRFDARGGRAVTTVYAARVVAGGEDAS